MVQIIAAGAALHRWETSTKDLVPIKAEPPLKQQKLTSELALTTPPHPAYKQP